MEIEITPIRRPRLTASVATALLVLAACASAGPYTPAGMVRDPAPDVGALSLPESTNGGTDFALKAESGHVLLLYFGYTQCPDICPTTLAALRSAVALLGEDRAQRVDVAFVTIDPERDTDPVMTAYTHAFFAEGHALRTDDPDRLFAVAWPLGVAYDVWTNENGDIEVMHSAWVYAIDEAGRMRLMWPFGTEPGDMAADLTYLLEEDADA